MSWSRAFDKPVALPRGGSITTLSEARDYLLKIPKKRQKSEAVETALDAVLAAAEGRGPMMHANVAMYQLVHGKTSRNPADPGSHLKLA